MDFCQNEICCVGDDVESIGGVGSCKWSPPRDDSPPLEDEGERERDKENSLLLEDGNKGSNEELWG